MQVTTKAGSVIRGLLKEEGANGFVLSNAEIMSQDQNGRIVPVKMDGEAVVPLDNIEYYQQGLDIALLGIA